MANNRRPNQQQPAKPAPEPHERIVPESPLKGETCSVTNRPHEWVLLRTDGIPAHEEVNPLSGQRMFVPPQPQWDTFFCRFCLEYLRRPASGTLGVPTQQMQQAPAANGHGLLVPFQRKPDTGDPANFDPSNVSTDSSEGNDDASLSAPEGRDYPGGAGA